MFFQVICRDDLIELRGRKQKGMYVLRTRNIFTVKQEAVDFKDGISSSRQPYIVTNCNQMSALVDAINKFDTDAGMKEKPRTARTNL